VSVRAKVRRRSAPKSANRVVLAGEPVRSASWTPALGRKLMAEAERARRSSYAPYSRFRVGAALLTADGRLFHGCNVENASFGLSICAERNAIWKAVSEGARRFVAIAVTPGPGRGASPCGACRQILNEFAPGALVLWRDPKGRVVEASLKTLLPYPFGPRSRKLR